VSIESGSARDVVRFVVTVDKERLRRDLENSFIVERMPEVLRRSQEFADYFFFSRYCMVGGEQYGDSIWLRFKVKPGKQDKLVEGVGSYLRALEEQGLIAKLWEPTVETDREVFGTTPGLGPTSAYGSLWCCVDAVSRTALNLLFLSDQGRLDVPEWVVADLWVHFFYNALGIPDFTPCPTCKSDQSLRLARCHACGFELDTSERKKVGGGEN